MTNREEEVAIDLDDDNFDGEMIIEEDSTTRVKQAASKRKGRGFNNSQRGEKRDHFKDGPFDRLEDSTGKAQRSVEGWIVLVTNVHEELTEEDLIEKFAEYGPIKNIHMNLDRRTGYVKGYALIEYNEYEEAKNAISNLDGTDLQGKILKCDFAFVRGSHASHSVQQISKRREKR